MSTNTKTTATFDGKRIYITEGSVRAFDAVAQSLDYEDHTVLTCYQGGWRPRTSYSATTHAKEAVDLSASRWREKIWNGRRLGIWLDHRLTSEGPWEEHIHGARLDPGAAFLDPSMTGQQREYLAGGDGLIGNRKDDDRRPRYPDVRFVDDRVHARWVAIKATQGYDQAGGHTDDKTGPKRPKGYVTGNENIATVKVNGVEWLVFASMTFFRKSDFELYTKPVPTTRLRVANCNMPGPDKLPNPDARIKALMPLLNSAPPVLIGWQELIGIKREGVASDFAHDVDAALGEPWLMVRPTKLLNENYMSFDRRDLKLVRQYDDQILKAATGNRHLTRAVFEVRETGFVFAAGVGQLVSTPHDATPAEKAAQEADRQRQAKDAHRYIENVSQLHDDCPYVLMFDANTHNPLKALVDAGMKWTRTQADNSSTRDAATYTNYSKAKPSTNPDWIIDQTYVSHHFYCVGYTVRRRLDADGDYRKPRPSDHDPSVSSVRHPA